jgi:hypothetical protein
MAIANALRVNKDLISLKLNKNNIQVEGATVIANALKVNASHNHAKSQPQ